MYMFIKRHGNVWKRLAIGMVNHDRSTSTASAKDADSEATRLWHRRLGHAGEKALQTLQSYFAVIAGSLLKKKTCC